MAVVRSYEYDGFGRMVSSDDLDGHKTSYAYGLTGELTEVRPPLGQRQIFVLDEAGHLTKIVDTGTPSKFLGDVVGVNRITEYGYDIEGRRVASARSSTARVHQDSFITFDALGRMARVNDPDYEVNYSYDGVGNRTRINADYYNHIGAAPGYVQTQDLWYTYDELNRVLISQGLNLNGGTTSALHPGRRAHLQRRGERISARTSGEHMQARRRASGSQIVSIHVLHAPSGVFTERYTYDGARPAACRRPGCRDDDDQGGSQSVLTADIRTACAQL